LAEVGRMPMPLRQQILINIGVALGRVRRHIPGPAMDQGV
jgi:hypothetical protein